MERINNCKTNANNDWRSKHEPDLRKKIICVIVEKLKPYFPKHNQNEINNTAVKFEDKMYGIAKDKDDYLRKIAQKMNMMNQISRNLQSCASVNGTNTSDPAPTSQQWLPQNIQTNLNTPGSSGLPTQVPTTVSVAQNVNIHLGEGVHSDLPSGSVRQIQGSQQLLPQKPQSSNYMVPHQMSQQLLKEKIRHGNFLPVYMQQQAQSPSQKQQQQQLPIKQQLPNQTSLPTIQQSFHQPSGLSSTPLSGQNNSQFLPRPQFPTQLVPSSNQQEVDVRSQEQKLQEQEQLINQLMNDPDTQQNQLTSQQSNREQQGAFMISSFQQNNIASIQSMEQQSNNHQRLCSHSNNASALPSEQQQNMPCGASVNFNMSGSSLFGTQGQEMGQSQTMMLQQYKPQHRMQQPQNRILQQHLDSVQNDTQRFQASGSLQQTQNIADQPNQPYLSTSQDSSGKMVNATSGDWQEETYKKIKDLKEMYLPVLSTMLQKVTDKLQKIDSLPQQKMLYEPTEKLRAGKSTLEQVIVFLNVPRRSISEKHRDRFSLYEEQVLRLTRSQTRPWRSMQQQQQQVQFPPSQIHQTTLQSQSGLVHMSQSLDNNQINSRLMSSNQNGNSSSVSGLTTSMPHSLQTRPNMEPKDDNKITASSGNVVYPASIHSNMFQQKQFHHLQLPQTNQQLQLSKNEMNDVMMRQGINLKPGLLQQHLSSSQRQLPKPLASSSQMSNFPPSASSPQFVDQQILPASVNKTGTSSLSGDSPFVSPSPVTSFALSPIPGDPEKPIYVESPVSHAYQFQTAAQSPSSFGVAQEHPLVTLPPEPNAEQPIHRLIKAFQSSSPQSLAESVSEMSSVISLADRIAGSFCSIGGSKASLAEDLSARTKFHLQARNLMTQGEKNPTKRLKRSINTMPLDIASQTESYKQNLENEVDSTASSGSKVNKIEPGSALLQEIKKINARLVETVVDISCDQDANPSEVTSGTIVTCSYSPVALSATFEAHYKSGQITKIQPLRLLVPANYPFSPPILLDSNVHNCEDLSARTRSRFSVCMKQFAEPIFLEEIAQTWNDCARETMAEYGEKHGGGTYSSKYGHWETVTRTS